MMAIWYSASCKEQKYFKFIIFNSLKIKIVSNDNVMRANQNIQIFEDGANLLDGITNLFRLDLWDLSELVQFIIEEY